MVTKWCLTTGTEDGMWESFSKHLIINFVRLKDSPSRLGWALLNIRFLLDTEASSNKLLPPGLVVCSCSWLPTAPSYKWYVLMRTFLLSLQEEVFPHTWNWWGISWNWVKHQCCQRLEYSAKEGPHLQASQRKDFFLHEYSGGSFRWFFRFPAMVNYLPQLGSGHRKDFYLWVLMCTVIFCSTWMLLPQSSAGQVKEPSFQWVLIWYLKRVGYMNVWSQPSTVHLDLFSIWGRRLGTLGCKSAEQMWTLFPLLVSLSVVYG